MKSLILLRGLHCPFPRPPASTPILPLSTELKRTLECGIPLPRVYSCSDGLVHLRTCFLSSHPNNTQEWKQSDLLTQNNYLLARAFLVNDTCHLYYWLPRPLDHWRPELEVFSSVHLASPKFSVLSFVQYLTVSDRVLSPVVWFWLGKGYLFDAFQWHPFFPLLKM